MPAPPTAVDDAVRELYRGPLAAFTAGRQALAKRLRNEGDPGESQVRELRKPTLSAWAVNQLFALEQRAMGAFVGAGERARAAQRRVASGGDPAPLRQLLETIRTETARLTARGAALLAVAERAPGEAIVERVRTNLEALALDAEVAALAARGWLDADLDPPGFEVMAALQVAAAGARPAKAAAPASPARPARAGAVPTPAATADGKRARGRDAAAARAEREGEARRLLVARAEEELARAEADATAARGAAESAADEAARWTREAEVAARRGEEARRRAGDAHARAARAEAGVRRAREALARAQSS